ncbi:MAG: tetratricopeptide repeat protein [Planctomycetota bacterium]|nr:MAG: tetratricopeptide repeat protein [Planctomycetota bacterium]
MSKAFQQCRHFLIYVILILVTFVSFSPVLNHGFVDYDDNDYVTENPHVKAGLTRDSIIWAFTAEHSSNWHPLTWLSHMLDCQLFGTEPWGHHLMSLLIHIINTVLLFAMLKKMTGTLWRSFFVAAAFALHPLHVESVTWIAERKDVLSGLFWFLTVAAYLQYVKHPGKINYSLIVVVFALGLMAKPILVTLPFVLLLLDFWPLERFQRHNACRLVGEKVPLLCLSAISSVITFIVQQRTGAVARIEQVAFDSRVANAFISYIVYLSKMIWPSRLAVFYPYPTGAVSIWLAVLAALLVVCISICLIWLARNRKYLLTGWFWYIGALVPVIGLIQVGGQVRADRYTYLPSIGIFIIVAWSAAEVLAKWRYRRVVLSVSGGLVICAMVLCARLQLRHWQDSFTLFKHSVEVTKNNYVGHTGLGKALRAQGKLDEAIEQYHEALRIKPDYAITHYNLGNALLAQGKVDEAIDEYHQTIQFDENYTPAFTNLGGALATKGNLDEAIDCFRKAVDLEPNEARTHYNLGYVLELKGSLDEAIKQYRLTLQINSVHTKARDRLEATLAKQKRSK